MRASQNTTRHRIFGLDLYRAVAILLVVFAHGRFMLKDTPLEGFPWIKLTDGVELFFVLSGFLIGQILLRLLRDQPKLSATDLFQFWKRRWMRTLPNYYLFLLINMALAYAGLSLGQSEYIDYRYFLFLQNFVDPLYGFFWESWSLAVEEWFYLLFPIVLFALARFLKPNTTFLITATLFIVLPILYRVSIASGAYELYQWDTEIRKTVITRLDSIFYGVLAAWIKWTYPETWMRHTRVYAIVGFIMLGVLTYLPIAPESFFYQTFYFNLLSIGAMLLLPLADGIKRFEHPLGHLITRISLISYALYLTHLSPLAHVIDTQWPIHSTANALLAYFAYWAIAISVSEVVYRFFEHPIMAMRDKRSSKKRT